jgi:hypothetical protein
MQQQPGGATGHGSREIRHAMIGKISNAIKAAVLNTGRSKVRRGGGVAASAALCCTLDPLALGFSCTTCLFLQHNTFNRRT